MRWRRSISRICPLKTVPIWKEARVRLDAPQPGLRARIEAVLENKPVRLARIETRYSRASEGATAARAKAIPPITRNRWTN